MLCKKVLIVFVSYSLPYIENTHNILEDLEESYNGQKLAIVTTVNNNGYKAHKGMGHVPQLSSHPKPNMVKISG